MKASDRKRMWLLKEGLVFLNHGSFGSCPRPVLEFQQELRLRLERDPIQFLVRDLEGLLDEARSKLAAFLNASPENLVAVPNATAGVNSVLRSLRWRRGDELLVTDHEYQACRNALDFVAGETGATVITAAVPFPVQSPDEIVEAVMARVTDRTRLVLIDHITSQTALVVPVERLVAELNRRQILSLVDGAHAPGMVPVDLTSLGATFYTGNCHKWLCAPKGAGFLYVDERFQDQIRPLVISHGASSRRSDRSRFLVEFGWPGTWDPTAFLSVPVALDLLGTALPGGWGELMARNRRLALRGREILCRRLDLASPAPEEMIGSMASIPIADGSPEPPASPLYLDALQEELRSDFGIEVPVVPWPRPPRRLLRISAQIYNNEEEYARLADSLALVFRATGVKG